MAVSVVIAVDAVVLLGVDVASVDFCCGFSVVVSSDFLQVTIRSNK